ncbi:MAG: c-type cytochrome [Chitinophagaceae bacterium]
MKKIIIACFAALALISCNSSSSKDEKSDKSADITQDPDYQKGLALVAKNKCLTCHAIDETITGPPYREVAKKYADLPDTILSHLAGKIISGGNGVWGEIFMTPHPDVSKEDAETMVKYILLLKK